MKRILFGTVDINYRINNYSRFITEYFPGMYKCESLVIFKLPHAHFPTYYTYEYQISEKKNYYRIMFRIAFFIFALFRYQVFYFISGETILNYSLRSFELKLYKLLKKKVIMHFVGSDIRNEGYLYWKDENLLSYLNGHDNRSIIQKDSQKQLIELANVYADRVIVSTPDLLQLISKAVYFPVVLDINHTYQKELFIKPINSQSEIIILHSPSSMKNNLKGTKKIEEVLIELQKEKRYNIKLFLPYKLKNENTTDYSSTRIALLNLYETADIVIDQMVIGWYGMVSIESLAAGKQTICYIDSRLEKYLYPDCPIINANITNLKDKIYECIERLLNRSFSSEKQIAWVKKYHTIENIHDVLIYSIKSGEL